MDPIVKCLPDPTELTKQTEKVSKCQTLVTRKNFFHPIHCLLSFIARMQRKLPVHPVYYDCVLGWRAKKSQRTGWNKMEEDEAYKCPY